jgi:hypothetical protein
MYIHTYIHAYIHTYVIHIYYICSGEQPRHEYYMYVYLYIYIAGGFFFFKNSLKVILFLGQKTLSVYLGAKEKCTKKKNDF